MIYSIILLIACCFCIPSSRILEYDEKNYNYNIVYIPVCINILFNIIHWIIYNYSLVNTHCVWRIKIVEFHTQNYKFVGIYKM